MASSETGVISAAERLAARALYSWQRRLLRAHLLRGDIPDAIDVPTGLGKTTVIALWLAALACGARLPRRLVYVVDRRAVVDQATAEAEALARVLGSGDAADATLVKLRDGLGLSAGEALPVSTLRGQYVDNRLWLASPAIPAIVVGTVDMIGSRLLFSGYGVSRRLRPMHAGLLGVDALIVLDEAHLVPPFESLVRQIQALRGTSNGQALPSFRVMALSATGRTVSANTFRLSEEDIGDPRLNARLHASKRLRVLTEVPTKEFAEAIALRAWELAQPAFAVLVFCNSRKAAVDVAELLGRRVRETYGKSTVGVELLVGERRVLERGRLAESRVFRRFLPRQTDAPGDKPATEPVFLVATSAGEVGVDLDADHIACDLVPWERMVQRLGRVNRRPQAAQVATIEVVPVISTTSNDQAESVVDADRLQALRAPFDHPAWPIDGDGYHDVSAAALYGLKNDERLAPRIQAATTPEPLRPALSGPLVDAWAMTSLPEHSGRPDVQPWLRGWVDDDPQTRLVWRRWFPLRATTDGIMLDDERVRERDLKKYFEGAAPHLGEVLEAPTHKVVALLKKRAAAWLDARNRVETEGGSKIPAHVPMVVSLNPAGDFEECFDVNDLARQRSERFYRAMTNRTVVIDARLGGLDANGLLNAAAADMPLTLDADNEAWPDLAQTVGFRVRRAPADAAVESDWRIEYRWRYDVEADAPEAIELRVEVWRGDLTLRGDPAIARFEQELAAHCDAVAVEVAAIAERLQLEDPVRATLRIVGQLHDLGKARSLWQRAMCAPCDGKVYAKTKGNGVPRLLEIDGETYRHEFGSLRDAISTDSLRSLPRALRDLALHLIAAHHGYARPVIAAVDPDQPPSLCPPLAQDTALRFARLNREWGAWELAWWEALFRAADWKVSATKPEEKAD